MGQMIDLDKMTNFTDKLDALFREHNITKGQATIIIDHWKMKQELARINMFLEERGILCRKP